jgi:ubiquinone/menaquinone biosynthesis C-methylase UbiE
VSDSVEAFQITAEAAWTYESRFVPALFGEWAPHLLEAAKVAPGDCVLDVACGTGVLARAAVYWTGAPDLVVGLDLNEAMLSVARAVRPEIRWRQGDAAALPFPDGSFDVVACQAGLMFFPDVAQALREMARVVNAAGRVVVHVWDGLESQTGYAPLVEAVARHAGSGSVELMSAYFSLGDLGALTQRFESAGLDVTQTRTRTGTVRFESIDEFVTIEVESTPLTERIDDGTYARIRADAIRGLADLADERGMAKVPIRGHVVTARKR